MNTGTTIQPFRVDPKAMHELIIMPAFGDVLDDVTGKVVIPSDEEGDWQIMDDVVYERPIMDLFSGQNILKRKDATCKLIYSPVGRLGNRMIRTEKLYAATEDCMEEYYQGAFEDYSSGNLDEFMVHIMPIMESGVGTDIYTNKYFGDVTRDSDPTGTWSWNKFDGVFTWITRYINDGTIPAEQSFVIAQAGASITPGEANDALNTAFAKQNGIMRFWSKEMKVFYVDESLAEAYHEYLLATGYVTVNDLMTGKPILYKKGILIKVKKWDPLLAALDNGDEHHAVILTVKGNFLYATDSNYGGGMKRNEAIRIWYSEDDGVWRRQIHLKAGTQIAAPQMITLGATDGVI